MLTYNIFFHGSHIYYTKIRHTLSVRNKFMKKNLCAVNHAESADDDMFIFILTRQMINNDLASVVVHCAAHS